MSFQYDQYLANHRANVKRGFDWLCENLPDVTNDISDAAWSLIFGGTMNRTTKINILAYASEPDKNYEYDGDIVDYKGKRYFVSLAEERVKFIGIIKEDK